MCHHVHVKLTAADEQAVKKMYGVMVPVFASIVLLALTVLVVTHQPRAGEVLTAEAASAPSLAVPAAR